MRMAIITIGFVVAKKAPAYHPRVTLVSFLATEDATRVSGYPLHNANVNHRVCHASHPNESNTNEAPESVQKDVRRCKLFIHNHMICNDRWYESSWYYVIFRYYHMPTLKVEIWNSNIQEKQSGQSCVRVLMLQFLDVAKRAAGAFLRTCFALSTNSHGRRLF